MFHKLLAYKDEYEVARLMRSADGLAPAAEVTGGSLETVRWHLHPPSMRAIGFDRKLRFRNRSARLFDVLASGKRLRGTALDPFGRSELRRLERQLPSEYESAIARVVAALTNTTISGEQATQIAWLPDQVRGYEDLKIRRAAEYRAQLERSIAELG
jgi:indolepyruvate ferredoxin oxidoreductase